MNDSNNTSLGLKQKDYRIDDIDWFGVAKLEKPTTLNVNALSFAEGKLAEEKVSPTLNNSQPKLADIPHPEQVKEEFSNKPEQGSEITQTKTTVGKMKLNKLKNLRADVVNKTFIRSIRRYYSALLWNVSEENRQMNIEEDPESVLQSIDSFCNEIFLTQFPEVDISKTITAGGLFSSTHKGVVYTADQRILSLYELKMLLTSMLLRNTAKKYIMTRMVKTQYSCYYDVVYKYSHKKMMRLLKLASFKLLFQHFVNSGGLDKMLAEDETLNANCDLYKEKANAIINGIF